MNIYAKHGDKVVFDQPDNGHEHERKEAAELLAVGTTYTVDCTEVHSWHTDVWLVEVPDVRFNSVLFSDKETVSA